MQFLSRLGNTEIDMTKRSTSISIKKNGIELERERAHEEDAKHSVTKPKEKSFP